VDTFAGIFWTTDSSREVWLLTMEIFTGAVKHFALSFIWAN